MAITMNVTEIKAAETDMTDYSRVLEECST